MSERAAYSRVYWSVIDDPKFAHVYDDDRALATWLRLLLVADQAWPASAHLPGTTRRQAVSLLVSAGLIDIQPGGRYRIHGLDAERTRRKDAATRNDPGRGGNRNPTGTQQGPNRDPNGPGTTGLSLEGDEKEKETSQDEQAARDPLDGPLAYYEVTTRYPSHNSELHAWTTTLAEGYGAETFQKALAAEFTISRSLKDLLSRTESRLAMAADRNRKRNPVKFDRAAWVEQKRREQEARYEGGQA